MTIETKKARFTKEELATEFEIGNLEERFNNARKLVRYRLNSKGTKCWSVYGVYDNKMTPDGNGGWKSTAKTGWHNAPAKVANDMLVQQCGITLVDFVNIEEFMNNREQVTDKDPTELEQANAQPATGYIFTKIKIVTGFGREGHSTQVERHDTKCKTLGDAFHFEGVYRELTFFDDNCNEGWELKTASGKLIAEGKTSAEAKKVRDTLCNPANEETDGSEDDPNEETFTAIIPTEDNDYDETDEPEILNADLFVNLYRSPIQERYASVTRTINGEQLHFFQHRLTNISAPALNLEVYFDNGRMNFWHGNKRIARDKVWQVPIIKETTKAQTESFGKFFAGDHTPKFFKVSVYPTFADGSEHNYVRYFDYFNQAQKFVEEVKTFVGDVPNQIYITSGGQYLYTRINGTEHYSLPAVDVTEAQSRLDELNKAIADNESFADKCDDDLTASKLRIANSRNKRSIAYYEAASRMTEPATYDPPEETIAPEKPADDFMTKLNDLSAAVAIANAEDRKACDAEVEAYNAWQAAKQKVEETADKYRAAINAFKTLGCQKAKELRNTLLENDIKLFSDAKIKIINQQGEEVARPDLSQIFITFYDGVFKVSASWDNFATYDTPAEVTDVITRLKAAIARGDTEFSFEVVDDVKELIA